MKRKLFIFGIVAFVVMGGAIGVGALSDAEAATNEMNTTLSTSDAEEIAKTEVPGEVVKVEKDEDDGVIYYEIDIRNEKGYVTDLEVHAETGEVTEIERDVEAIENNKSHKEDQKKVSIDRDQAISIAEEEAKGKLVDLEWDDSHYELEFEDGNVEYEVKVHGETGEIIEFEKDDD
ncbi:PepSY domain-containing protein [Halobacillus sp. B23F22_1]|uniref:PepSY domain-containing protein n=1 Tax=Halobacillus sp. B23F22_1 TaxID=3459514 RepID=UPI00373E249F